MWQNILLGIISSVIASLIFSITNIIIAMVSNKKKLRATIMIMFSCIHYDFNKQAVDNLDIIKSVFTYNQYINLSKLTVVILNKKKAKDIVDCVGDIVEEINKNQNVNIPRIEVLLTKLNEMFEQF